MILCDFSYTAPWKVKMKTQNIFDNAPWQSQSFGPKKIRTPGIKKKLSGGP